MDPTIRPPEGFELKIGRAGRRERLLRALTMIVRLLARFLGGVRIPLEAKYKVGSCYLCWIYAFQIGLLKFMMISMNEMYIEG